VLTANTTVTWSLLGESNSDYGLTETACSPLPLSRHELGAQVSSLEALGSRPSGSANSPTAHQEPPTGIEPAARQVQAGRSTRELKGNRSPGAIRTRTADLLWIATLTPGSTTTWSRHPVPTRISRLTRARSQPCVTASASAAKRLAAELGNQGSNLDSSGPEPDVLPELHHSP
jgi:hypothetical protein